MGTKESKYKVGDLVVREYHPTQYLKYVECPGIGHVVELVDMVYYTAYRIEYSIQQPHSLMKGEVIYNDGLLSPHIPQLKDWNI